MEVVHKVLRMRAVVKELRRHGRPVALVPTMGALHAGHLSLIRLARDRGAEVVVSIFVNPKQFAPTEDFDTYPRDLTRDVDLLVKESVAAVFAPEAPDMYPAGFSTHVEVEGLSDMLTGAHRPGHFRGVTTVVMKLLQVVQPDLAVFGMKDAQQLVIVQRMVRDLEVPVEIVAAPTVREPDGLAMSSRNVYLDPAARQTATLIHRALQEAVKRVSDGERSPAKVSEAVRAVLAAEPAFEVDYVKVVDARDFSEPKRLADLVFVLVSAKLKVAGRSPVTLIDNLRIEVPGES